MEAARLVDVDVLVQREVGGGARLELAVGAAALGGCGLREPSREQEYREELATHG